MTRALEGIRLLDLTSAIAGPWGTKYLAAFGAEVIKLEWRDTRAEGGTPPFLSPPGENADPIARPGSLNRSAVFADTNAGKRGITLNMRHPEGKALFVRLLRVSDGVMVNFRAGTLIGLGFSKERMREVRPDLIYPQASG